MKAVHRGIAIVEKINPDTVTRSHDPIASLKWGAMTMDFDKPEGGIQQGVREGSTVQFEFTEEAVGSYVLKSITPVASAGKSGSGAAK